MAENGNRHFYWDKLRKGGHSSKIDMPTVYEIDTVYIFMLQEHLLIVCELLKANLYEFHKFNRESGGEVYFTMPRLQVCRNDYYAVYELNIGT